MGGDGMKYILTMTTHHKNPVFKKDFGSQNDLDYIVSDDLPDLKKQYEEFIKRDDCYSATISIPIYSTDYECVHRWTDQELCNYDIS
jgi:hypothetical protein